MLRRLVILASGGLLLLGAACGGDSKDSSTKASTDETTVTTAASTDDAAASSGGATVDNCDDIGADDVAGIFGGEFSAMENTSRSGTTICSTQRGEPVTSVSYTIKPTSAGEYDATIDYSKKSGATAEPVSGIGDKATRLTTTKYGVTVIQVMVVKGNALFYAMASGEESYATQTEQLARLIADAL